MHRQTQHVRMRRRADIKIAPPPARARALSLWSKRIASARAAAKESKKHRRWDARLSSSAIDEHADHQTKTPSSSVLSSTKTQHIALQPPPPPARCGWGVLHKAALVHWTKCNSKEPEGRGPALMQRVRCGWGGWGRWDSGVHSGGDVVRRMWCWMPTPDFVRKRGSTPTQVHAQHLFAGIISHHRCC